MQQYFPESHPLTIVAGGSILFVTTMLATNGIQLFAIIVAGLLIAVVSNARVFPAFRKLGPLLAISSITLVAFLLLLVCARRYGLGLSIFSVSVDELAASVGMPTLRLVCGSVATLCIIVPFLSPGGLRRVLALQLPQSITLLVLATIANLYVFRASIDRVVTAHHAAGSFAGGVFGRLRMLAPIVVRIWVTAAIWLVDAFDYKWSAHDIPGLVTAYGHRTAGNYGRLRSALVVVAGIAPIILLAWEF